MKKFEITTQEYRVYNMKADSVEDAVDYLNKYADLRPKDKRAKLKEMVKFKVIHSQ